MTSTTLNNGRLGNQIIRNLAVSIIAEKYDLYVNYCNFECIRALGIELFVGKNQYTNIQPLTDNNYFNILSQDQLTDNLNPNDNYFQTKEITQFLYTHLHKEENKRNIIKQNPYKHRYAVNNDLFIHIRLTDVAKFNPGLEYYVKAISNISFDTLYIASDDTTHSIIQELCKIYPTIKIIKGNEIDTIQFGSTCRYIILSHGSFSAIIGYLAFFSTIYYPEYDMNKMWYGDIFSIDAWNKIE
jgi:hypothetical protein